MLASLQIADDRLLTICTGPDRVRVIPAPTEPLDAAHVVVHDPPPSKERPA
jgi:hypothetical protein